MSARIPLTLARALAPIAPPQSEVHRIISEADALAADRAANVNKAERAVERNAEYALRLQQRYEDAMDAAINNYGSGRGTL